MATKGRPKFALRIGNNDSEYREFFETDKELIDFCNENNVGGVVEHVTLVELTRTEIKVPWDNIDPSNLKINAARLPTNNTTEKEREDPGVREEEAGETGAPEGNRDGGPTSLLDKFRKARS